LPAWTAPHAAQRRQHYAIIERLEALDVASRRLSYALLTDTPFGNCLTTMSVRDLGPNQAELAWSATFQPDGLPASEALLERALAANCLEFSMNMPGLARSAWQAAARASAVVGRSDGADAAPCAALAALDAVGMGSSKAKASNNLRTAIHVVGSRAIMATPRDRERSRVGRR
jgi:hypothetical protein